MSELQDTCRQTDGLLHYLMSQPDFRAVLTPDVRVVHARLMIGQRDEGRVGRPPVDQVQKDLGVVDRQVVHVLWGWTGMCQFSDWGRPCWKWADVCAVLTYWSRSRSRSPPCPWPVSWRPSMPEGGTVGTAIWPPEAWQRSTDSTSTHTFTCLDMRIKMLWYDSLREWHDIYSGLNKHVFLHLEKKILCD